MVDIGFDNTAGVDALPLSVQPTRRGKVRAVNKGRIIRTNKHAVANQSNILVVDETLESPHKINPLMCALCILGWGTQAIR